MVSLFIVFKRRLTSISIKSDPKGENETTNNEYEYKYTRHDKREKRSKKEIGLHAVRGGTIVGEHNIYFAGIDEVVELTHVAQSKAVFGKGAIEAAKFLARQPKGLYNMEDVIRDSVI